MLRNVHHALRASKTSQKAAGIWMPLTLIPDSSLYWETMELTFDSAKPVLWQLLLILLWGFDVQSVRIYLGTRGLLRSVSLGVYLSLVLTQYGTNKMQFPHIFPTSPVTAIMQYPWQTTGTKLPSSKCFTEQSSLPVTLMFSVRNSALIKALRDLPRSVLPECRCSA
jgi:hypothetical protein